MKIEWTDGAREIPGVGFLSPGDIREVPDDLGHNLVRQGQAVKIRKSEVNRHEDTKSQSKDQNNK